MNEWKAPLPLAAIDAMLGKLSNEVDAMKMAFQDLPSTPEAAELALMKSLLEFTELQEKLVWAQMRYESLRKNFIEIRIKQLEIGKPVESEKQEIKHEQTDVR